MPRDLLLGTQKLGRMRRAGSEVKRCKRRHGCLRITLTLTPTGFEDAVDSLMDRLDAGHCDLVQPERCRAF